jgi:hypothetical protein
VTIAAWSLLLIFVTQTPSVRDKPDFSGSWVADATQRANNVPRALIVRLTVISTNVRGEPMTPYYSAITIEREFETGARTETNPLGVAGGSVGGVNGSAVSAGPIGSKTHYSVIWEDNVLVFNRGSYTGDAPDMGTWTEHIEAWTLQPDGRLRVTVTTRGSDGPLRTITTMYRRAP